MPKYITVTDTDILDRIKEIYNKAYKDDIIMRAIIHVCMEHGIIEIFYREDCSNMIFVKNGVCVDLYIRNEDTIYVNCVPYVIYRR